MSQEEGVERLSQTTPVRPPLSKGWTEFLTFCDLYPHLSHHMSIIYEVNQQACSIYLLRLSIGPKDSALTDQVNQCMSTLKQLPKDSPGEYSLIWPVFLVALESSTDEQRSFFTDFLLRQHRRSSFTYIAKAIKYLNLRWDQHDYDWTHSLTDLEVFVV